MGDAVLRFRLNGRAPASHRFVLYRDGSIEQWQVDENGSSPSQVIRSYAGRGLVERVLARAAEVMASGQGGDEVDRDAPHALELELLDPGSPRLARFSRNAEGLDEPARTARIQLRQLLELARRSCELATAPSRLPVATRTPVELPVHAPAPRPAPPTSMGALVHALVASPLSRLSDLEQVIGSLDFCSHEHDGLGFISRPKRSLLSTFMDFSPLVSSVNVQYDFDMHHERRYALDDGRRERNPGLQHVSLTLRVPKNQPTLLGELLDATGCPSEAMDDSPLGPCRRHGRLYHYAESPRLLHWYGTPPEWAIPKADDAARARWISALAELLRAECGYDDLVGFMSARPEEVRVPTASEGHDRAYYNFTLEPGMDALAFGEAFGLDPVLALSTDTHAQSWTLQAASGEATGRTQLLELGGWRVEARIRGWPKPANDQGVFDENEGAGLPPTYDLRHCEPTRVGSVTISSLQRHRR
ncbi:MAG: hypothetical protein RL653_1731 [Pseudomonadota bacterium]|jgi:hypothetical protein